MAKASGSGHDRHRAGGNDAPWGARLRGPRLLLRVEMNATARRTEQATGPRPNRRATLRPEHAKGAPWFSARPMANGAGQPSADLGRTNADHRYCGISGGRALGSRWTGPDPYLPIDRPVGCGRSWSGANGPSSGFNCGKSDVNADVLIACWTSSLSSDQDTAPGNGYHRSELGASEHSQPTPRFPTQFHPDTAP